ncbi:hypothetical protein [Streptomyces roseoverticillatus]|uniref:Uncharacterized protein n=1 Tax=Streptomyces roseoverticillatus TaxID=66429 RepID=A0ABV3J6Q2_9ACTN
MTIITNLEANIVPPPNLREKRFTWPEFDDNQMHCFLKANSTWTLNSLGRASFEGEATNAGSGSLFLIFERVDLLNKDGGVAGTLDNILEAGPKFRAFLGQDSRRTVTLQAIFDPAIFDRIAAATLVIHVSLPNAS